MALLTALFTTALLMGLGLAVLLLGSAETTLAAHDRDARALGYASRAAASVALADLRALPSWAALGTPGVIAQVSLTPGQFVDSTFVPAAPWGGAALDLRALTVSLQAERDAAAPAGSPPARWLLFEYGPLIRLVPESASRNPCYLVVWVADEHGLVIARAVAYGPGEGRSITEISVVRQPGADPVRILTVRPGA